MFSFNKKLTVAYSDVTSKYHVGGIISLSVT